MAISQRQFTHLNEMGIKVWQQRNVEQSSEITKSETSQQSQNAKHSTARHSAKTEQPIPITINSEQLTQQLIFTDILQSIDVSIGEVSFDDNVINLGLFNWQFIETDTISFANSTLTTPALGELNNSTILKRELWKIIQQEVLA